MIHGHHPDLETEDKGTGKLIHLPESMEGLLMLAGENLVIQRYIQKTRKCLNIFKCAVCTL